MTTITIPGFSLRILTHFSFSYKCCRQGAFFWVAWVEKTKSGSELGVYMSLLHHLLLILLLLLEKVFTHFCMQLRRRIQRSSIKGQVCTRPRLSPSRQLQPPPTGISTQQVCVGKE